MTSFGKIPIHYFKIIFLCLLVLKKAVAWMTCRPTSKTTKPSSWNEARPDRSGTSPGCYKASKLLCLRLLCCFRNGCSSRGTSNDCSTQGNHSCSEWYKGWHSTCNTYNWKCPCFEERTLKNTPRAQLSWKIFVAKVTMKKIYTGNTISTLICS